MITIQPTTTTLWPRSINAIKSHSNLKVEKPFTPPSDLISNPTAHPWPYASPTETPPPQPKSASAKASLFPRNFVSIAKNI